MTASGRHETRALLRAHLAAASGYRHLTRRCPICHQLQRLVMESTTHTAPRSAPALPHQADSERALQPVRAVQTVQTTPGILTADTKAASGPDAPQAPAQAPRS